MFRNKVNIQMITLSKQLMFLTSLADNAVFADLFRIKLHIKSLFIALNAFILL